MSGDAHSQGCALCGERGSHREHDEVADAQVEAGHRHGVVCPVEHARLVAQGLHRQLLGHVVAAADVRAVAGFVGETVRARLGSANLVDDVVPEVAHCVRLRHHTARVGLRVERDVQRAVCARAEQPTHRRVRHVARTLRAASLDPHPPHERCGDRAHVLVRTCEDVVSHCWGGGVCERGGEHGQGTVGTLAVVGSEHKALRGGPVHPAGEETCRHHVGDRPPRHDWRELLRPAVDEDAHTVVARHAELDDALHQRAVPCEALVDEDRAALVGGIELVALGGHLVVRACRCQCKRRADVRRTRARRGMSGCARQSPPKDA